MLWSEPHIDYVLSKAPHRRFLGFSEASVAICRLALEENSFTPVPSSMCRAKGRRVEVCLAGKGAAMNRLIKSWHESANAKGCPFPLNNLPYGVFSTGGSAPRCCVALGDHVIDLHELSTAGLLEPVGGIYAQPAWNAFMQGGPDLWRRFRTRLTELFSLPGDPALRENEPLRDKVLLPAEAVQMHLPFQVTEFTDFFASRHHAQNVGAMVRDPENALPPSWLHMPIGYNGRASSIVVSGTDVRRPWGQLKGREQEMPEFAACRRFDFELELGAVVGVAMNGPVSVQEADDAIFGYVLLNDWSARDIQFWEYQPLGPFQAKATATSIGAWIVSKAALEPSRVNGPSPELPLLPYLKEPGPMLYDIQLSAALRPHGGEETVVTQTNYREMYYSAAQQIAHHTTSGCPMRVGDLIGSGTISGPTPESRACLLERAWGGAEPFELGGGDRRVFLEDGDTVTLSGAAIQEDVTIGFGECEGTILPALKKPYAKDSERL